MKNWDEWLTWQAEVTDAIDREEQEITTYRAVAKILLARRDHAIQLDRILELNEIDSYLAHINMLVKMKTLLIKRMNVQFRQASEAMIS